MVNTTIVHKLAHDAPFKEGDVVKLEIDWQRRYELMRYHSACHFLYHAAHQVYDKPGDAIFTKGCSISATGARLDFFGEIDGARMPEVEKLANDLIARPMDIVMDVEPLTQDIHYWKCGDIVIPCGGTHVRSTTELSSSRVTREEGADDYAPFMRFCLTAGGVEDDFALCQCGADVMQNQ